MAIELEVGLYGNLWLFNGTYWKVAWNNLVIVTILNLIFHWNNLSAKIVEDIDWYFTYIYFCKIFFLIFNRVKNIYNNSFFFLGGRRGSFERSSTLWSWSLHSSCTKGHKNIWYWCYQTLYPRRTPTRLEKI